MNQNHAYPDFLAVYRRICTAHAREVPTDEHIKARWGMARHLTGAQLERLFQLAAAENSFPDRAKWQKLVRDAASWQPNRPRRGTPAIGAIASHDVPKDYFDFRSELTRTILLHGMTPVQVARVLERSLARFPGQAEGMRLEVDVYDAMGEVWQKWPADPLAWLQQVSGFGQPEPYQPGV